jgi:hypothetical protein
MDEQNQSLMTNPMQIISHSFGWSNISALPALVAGWAAGKTVAMQLPPDASIWQNSALIALFSTLAVGIFMLLGKLLDKYFEGKAKKQERADELHEKEIEFWKTQLSVKHISEFEARARAHRFGNETNRLSLHIFALHALMSKNNIEIPDFHPKHYDELMVGLDEEVAKFKISLAERFDEVIHRTER